MNKSSSYKTPIRDLVSKKDLNPEEKIRLSTWYFDQGKTSEAKKLIDEKSTSWVKLAIDLESEPTFKKINSYLENLKSTGSLCGDESMSTPLESISSFLKKSKSSSNKTLALINKYESIIIAQKKEDPLGCAYLLDYLYGYGQYMIKGTSLKNKKEFFKKKTLQNAMNYPVLPGVKKKNQLEYTISRLKENKKETKKLMDKLRSENKDDHTYDILEAYYASYKKNYEKALEMVNKSLKIARDRNWQKALSLKIKILIDMGKKKEAQKIIKDTLVNIELPYSKSPKIHSFVQRLRKHQVAILKTKK